jgi:hypothetical protein
MERIKRAISNLFKHCGSQDRPRRERRLLIGESHERQNVITFLTVRCSHDFGLQDCAGDPTYLFRRDQPENLLDCFSLSANAGLPLIIQQTIQRTDIEVDSHKTLFSAP